MKPLTAHELVELRAWTAGIGRDARERVERVIDEAERARFALNEIAVHLEGLQHIRKLTPAETAILGQAREGLRPPEGERR